MDKIKVKKISQEITESGMRDNKKLKQLINNITIMSVKDATEELIECCLLANVDCEYIIDKYQEFKDGKLSESDLHRIIIACMMP